MKKIFKNSVSIFLIALLITIPFNISAFHDNAEINTSCKVKELFEMRTNNNIYQEQINENNEVSYLEYIKEMEELNQSLIKIQEYSDSSNTNLKENFAGAYIDTDGKLVYLVSTDNKLYQNLITEIVGNNNIKIKSVEYSYQSLEVTKDDVTNKLIAYYDQLKDNEITNENLKNLLNSFHSVYIDEKNNTVVVEITELSPELEQAFHTYISANENIVIRTSNGQIQQYASPWRTGRGIYIFSISVNSNGSITATARGGYSTGYMASRGANKGFVTSAHGNNTGDYVFINSSITYETLLTDQLGQITKRVLSGSVDAAFVEITNDNYEQSNLVYYTSVYPGVTKPGSILAAECVDVNGLALNTWIYKSGMTTYLTVGDLLDRSITVNISGNILTDLFMTDNVADHGDSGGVTYISSEKVIGIVEGGNGTYTYFIKATNINEALGVVVN